MAHASSPVLEGRHVPTWGDFLYDAFYSGAIGGSVVALFFLLIDAATGRPLFTPSLMGTVLFTGADPAAVTEVHIGMVAAYSAVHFALFTLLGLGVAFAVREVELHARNRLGVLLGLFLVFEWAFFVGTLVFMPGVMAVLGALRVAMANLLAAGAIAFFVFHAHREMEAEDAGEG